jgi:hypothetical protein
MTSKKAPSIHAKLAHWGRNELLEQKYIDLSTTYDRMQLKVDASEFSPLIITKIDDLLASQYTWDNANTIEQLLSPLYNDDELNIEIKLKLLEAKQRLDPGCSDLFCTEYTALKSQDSKLNLLCNLYKKLQVSYDIEQQKKRVISSIRFSTSMIFLLSIIIFFLMDNMRLLDLAFPVAMSDKYEFLVGAWSAGWMGACFSMLMRLKSDLSHQSLSELNSVNRIDNVISRSLIGMVSGLLIFFAFEATLMQGVLFPSLVFDIAGSYADVDNTWSRNKSHAMLVFWCFLAGFSEKMIPELLGKAEQKVADEGM